MLFYIEVLPQTLPLITELNNGVTPKVETETTMFVWNSDPEGHNDILPVEKFEELLDNHEVAVIMPVVQLV